MDQTSTSRPPAARLVLTGCLFMVLGAALFIATRIAEAAGASKQTLQVMTIVALILVVPPLVYLVGYGLYLQIRARRGLERLAFAPEVPLDVPAMRRIESTRLPALAQWDRFPSRVVTSRRLDNATTPISFAVNLPSLRKKSRFDPIEPAACYVWFPIPVELPRIILRPDSRDSALLGPDIDVENEEFNRRFRVDSAVPLVGGSAKYDEFARYAHALLHPRAVEALLRLPFGVHAGIDGGVGLAIDRVDSERERIEQVAAVLTEFVSLVPEHVLRRWGNQSDYHPRA